MTKRPPIRRPTPLPIHTLTPDKINAIFSAVSVEILDDVVQKDPELNALLVRVRKLQTRLTDCRDQLNALVYDSARCQ